MSRKRPYGTGSVVKRGNSYRLVFSGPPGVDGKRKQITESLKGGTKKDAERVLRERISAVQNGGYIPRNIETIGQFVWRWFETHAVPNVSLKTQQGYRGSINRYIVPAIGSLRLQHLDPSDLQRMYASIINRGLSARTALHVHRLMHRILRDAVRWNAVQRNVADAVTPPKVRRPEMRIFTVQELQRFLDAAPDDAIGSTFQLAVLTGLRRSELAGLRWSDVDVDRSVLRVTQTLQRVSGHGLVIGEPKSTQSRRAVALGERAVKLLKGVKVRQLEEQLASGDLYEETGYVFADALGAPIDPDRVSKVFRRTVAVADVPKLGIHSLRHLHASLALEQGVDMKTTSVRLGHSQISVTADLYSHVTPAMQEHAARAVDDALAGM